jgi:2-polyprenyl-6-methoxyphenol hydroxylase-like FAD-dependent oxidoreductase
MTRSTHNTLPVLVSGGGIGGLAAALALVRQGFQVQVFEQAPEIGEIGAGIQLGPNAFHAFDALGVGDKARGRAVYTDSMVMHDASTKPRSARSRPARPSASASATPMR